MLKEILKISLEGFLNEGMSIESAIEQFASKYNIDAKNVRRHAIDLGFLPRSAPRRKIEISEDELAELLKTKTYREISEEFGSCINTIYNLVKKYGLQYIIKEKCTYTRVTKEELMEYLHSHDRLEAAKHFNLNISMLDACIRKYGLKGIRRSKYTEYLKLHPINQKPKKPMKSSLIEIIIEKTKNIVIEISQSFKFSEKDINDCIELTKVTCKNSLHKFCHYKPSAVAASVVYLYVRSINKKEITQEKISIISGVSSITIRKYIGMMNMNDKTQFIPL